MPSIEHEALVSLFQHRPELAAELLQVGFGVKVPEHVRACLESGALSEVAPVEFRADAVVVLRAGEDRDRVPVLAVVVEVQRRRDARKRRSWPMYLAALHARLGCDVVLLVVCPQRAVAAWCAKPIRLGHPGFELLPAGAKKYLEDLLATQAFTYSSPFTQQYVEQGRAAEAAESVLRVLAARDVPVPDDLRDRVRSCTDHELLTHWLTRAVHVKAAEELFD